MAWLRCWLLFAVLALPAVARAEAERLVLFGEAGPELFDKDVFALVEPGLAWTSESVTLELSAPLRLRVHDGPPPDRSLIRREDWDELSDFAQVLKELEVSAHEGAVRVRAGALGHEDLALGTLVSGYTNALDPDYHPVGVTASVTVGWLSVRGLSSDVLAPRVGALALVAEPLSVVGATNDRVHVTLEGATDLEAPRANTAPRPLGIWGAGLDAALLRTSTLRLAPYGQANFRLPGFGLHAGLLADATLGKVELALRGEWRRMKSPYEPEYFDAAYELERTALLGAPKAELARPTGNGFRAEARLKTGALSLAADVSSRNGGLLDVGLTAALDTGRVAVNGHALARAIEHGTADKVLFVVEARARLNPWLYAWVDAGKLYRLVEDVAADGSASVRARPAYRAGAGVGVEFEVYKG